ncbi:MAG: DNA alkylation repair protein [Balneolaceae bacterium]|nr:DNA alkylation repair protein [Balneolaceae bacterium]
MAIKYSITEKFGVNLAELLSRKIKAVYPGFKISEFISAVENKCPGLTYTQRVNLLADELHTSLPRNYENAVTILMKILEEENTDETGMFTHYYWILPIGKYVEKFGLEHFDLSVHAISEITKRNTGEYAIRPYIRAYPNKALQQMKRWAVSDNFHLRRLSSEGLRPKLPWATKLDTFIDDPESVFELLELLKEDPVRFVKKSVANHLTDWLKVNPEPTILLIRKWQQSRNDHTRWILKHATRKIDLDEIMKLGNPS